MIEQYWLATCCRAEDKPQARSEMPDARNSGVACRGGAGAASHGRHLPRASGTNMRLDNRALARRRVRRMLATSIHAPAVAIKASESSRPRRNRESVQRWGEIAGERRQEELEIQLVLRRGPAAAWLSIAGTSADQADVSVSSVCVLPAPPTRAAVRRPGKALGAGQCHDKFAGRAILLSEGAVYGH